MLTSLVLSNGTLNNDKILKREILYKGANGRFVERFFVAPSQSYIFKPLTNEKQIGKEVWIHNNILIDFPPIYPKILAHSITPDADDNWLILEDVGSIQRVFTKDLAQAVTKKMAWWHNFPTDKLIHEPLQGPKPQIEKIVEDILSKKDKVINLLTNCQVSQPLCETIFSYLKVTTFSSKRVLSHGDLHSGNYGYARNSMIILDWEHVHLNLPYWDLYHLLDISHPIFPRKITKEFRHFILDYYVKESGISDCKDLKSFKQGYYVFSLAFTIWMILLIQNDLTTNKTVWTESQLLLQLKESITSLIQCAEELERY